MGWRLANACRLAVAGIVFLAACSAQPSHAPGQSAIDVVHAWIDARNREDIEAVLALLSPTANVLGFAMQVPSRREALVAALEGQAVADWRINDTDCVFEGGVVTCAYSQDDAILRRWGLSFSGMHTYAVEKGLITRVARAHDLDSRDAGYAALRAFKDWVRDTHPDLIFVIWSDPTAATYATPAGAMAALHLLEEYEDFRARPSQSVDAEASSS